VLERLIPVERERRSRDGRWYIARFLPYRTPEDLISGVVLTFVDITERKKAEGEHARLHAAIAGAQEHLRLIFENVREYAVFPWIASGVSSAGTLEPNGCWVWRKAKYSDRRMT
jgi:two-component system CheB/CheR fusion protein